MATSSLLDFQYPLSFSARARSPLGLSGIAARTRPFATSHILRPIDTTTIHDSTCHTTISRSVHLAASSSALGAIQHSRYALAIPLRRLCRALFRSPQFTTPCAYVSSFWVGLHTRIQTGAPSLQPFWHQRRSRIMLDHNALRFSLSTRIEPARHPACLRYPQAREPYLHA
ncbi:hypothetical protein PENSPDRAFT_336122 [Peniophora sp. CONT]|nr:hypothetical protein PENSPDRAFT_336122 [Peniophora sp. CONT]